MLQFLPLCGCHPLRYTADIGGQASSQSRSRLERRRFNGLNSAAPSTCKAFSIELRELTALGYPGGDSILPNQPRRDSDVCLSSARCKAGKQCHNAVNEQ